MKYRYPLHTFVNRILVRRLVLVGLSVSILIGGTAWFQVRHLAADRAVGVALDRLTIIRAQYLRLRTAGVPREDSIFQAINSLNEMDFNRQRGFFVAGVFYDREEDFHVFGDSTLAASVEGAAIVGNDRSQRPELGESISSLVHVEDQVAIHVVVPIAGTDGQVAAWVSTVYLLTPDAAAELTSEPLQAVGLVVLIVLAISTLLYPVILKLARRLAEFSGDLLEANLEMMEALGCAIAKRDGDTDAHNYRVTIYSVRLAEKEGLSTKAIQGLIKGAFLHDIGKIGIRDNVLLKPGRLTEDEFSVMKTHVDHGLDIVGRSRWLHDALAIVGSHHEKFDGHGYPAKIPGDMIPATARIFAITDVFDALSSERPYKEALPLERVIAILEEGRGTHFDPDLLTSFLLIAPELHAKLMDWGTEELRTEMFRINGQYFASGLETLLA